VSDRRSDPTQVARIRASNQSEQLAAGASWIRNGRLANSATEWDRRHGETAEFQTYEMKKIDNAAIEAALRG